MSKYAIKSIFNTVQGEGHFAGVPALFVRFAGCNLWSGIEAKRGADANRTGADCPNWCDTDFRGGEPMTAGTLRDAVGAEYCGEPVVVITGGEPLLQLDVEALDAISRGADNARLIVETNGTVKPNFDPDIWCWVSMSPKWPRAKTVLTRCDDLKVVIPAYDPAEWEDFPAHYRWLQPCDDGSHVPAMYQSATRSAVNYVMAHPKSGWRVGSQAHKAWGIP